MHRTSAFFRSTCLALALASCTLPTACIHRAPRYYDPYYNDYHKWSDREIDYYQRWCRETHRDPDRAFSRLTADEQEEYFKWRHDQEKAHYKQPH